MRSRWVVSVVAVAGLMASSCTSEPSGPDPSPPTPSAEAEPTTLESYDATGATVPRAPFCDRVSPTGIERALGATPASHRDYGNGDRVRLPDGTRTIAHEYGCEWTGGDAIARAWVFVPPIARGRARDLVQAAAATPRCSRESAGDFGSPSLGLLCRGDEGVERSWRGLFGDGWLVCSLTGPRPAAVTEERASEWCASVLDAARA